MDIPRERLFIGLVSVLVLLLLFGGFRLWRWRRRAGAAEAVLSSAAEVAEECAAHPALKQVSDHLSEVEKLFRAAAAAGATSEAHESLYAGLAELAPPLAEANASPAAAAFHKNVLRLGAELDMV